MKSRYNSTKWQNAREAALARDRVCQDCGTNDGLHVRHIRPVRVFSSPKNAHHLSNLVVLCSSCHPKWEGRSERPNSLDKNGRVQLSQLVHQLSRETLGRLFDPPGSWILYQYYKLSVHDSRHRCECCFQTLPGTRGQIEYCPTCGRVPNLWKGLDGFDIEVAKRRTTFLWQVLSELGIPVDESAAQAAAEKLWSKDEYRNNGLIERLTHTVAYTAIKAGYDPDLIELEYEPICPEPKPIQTSS